MTDICTECGKEFEATNENSVDIKILGLYGVVCKVCYEKLKREGKNRLLSKGSQGALI